MWDSRSSWTPVPPHRPRRVHSSVPLRSAGRCWVANHHCDRRIRCVTDVRLMSTLGKAPFFGPPRRGRVAAEGGRGGAGLDHPYFPQLTPLRRGEPQADRALPGFAAGLGPIHGRAPRLLAATDIARTKHLDYTRRTAIYEGHLDRGCTAYGACERNIIALSIRNRARSASCKQHRGYRFPGDYQGVSSKVSQYNI